MNTYQKLSIIGASVMLLGFTAIGDLQQSDIDSNFQENLHRESRTIEGDEYQRFIKISDEDPRSSVPKDLLEKLKEPQAL